MFAHFDTEELIDTENLTYKLNSFLPNDIAIDSIFRVNENAHARFDAIKRTYNYKVSLKKDVFLHDYSYYTHQNLDIKKMNKAASILFE